MRLRSLAPSGDHLENGRGDGAEYPDVDLVYHKTPEGKHLFTHKDGSSYER